MKHCFYAGRPIHAVEDSASAKFPQRGMAEIARSQMC